MITAIVYFKTWVESGHWSSDGYYVNDFKIVEVERLTDINDMFTNITDVKIIDRT